MTTVQEKLRGVASTIRTKPTPLSDFIPLLNQTADHIDKLEAEVERLRKDAERKPMTDEDIMRIYGLSKSTTDFARNIELFIAEGTP